MEIEKIYKFQNDLRGKPVGEGIAFWAEQFVGLPYDTDPLGEYVRKNIIVFDERIDCMYHVFRSAELALSSTPHEAVSKALDLRFHTKGMIKDNKVLNYDDRFQYGEDMILSGKWGKDITSSFGKTILVEGSRGLPKQEILSGQNALKAVGKLQSGDIIFFIKDPKKRVAEEIVGHIGIIKIEHRAQSTEHRQQNKEYKETYLIHANGVKGKDGSGSVKKVPFTDYLKSMKFIGIKVSRFEG
ncbi:MAG: hypothetical protein HY756_06650 [Nitrospirae bacterium]|nr:hypothetical protein [Nitrospirota bacterium]